MLTKPLQLVFAVDFHFLVCSLEDGGFHSRCLCCRLNFPFCRANMRVKRSKQRARICITSLSIASSAALLLKRQLAEQRVRGRLSGAGTSESGRRRVQLPSPRLQKHRYASVVYRVPGVWQRACGVHIEQRATSWSFSVRGRRNRARAYSLMACSSRILGEILDRGDDEPPTGPGWRYAQVLTTSV